MPYTPPVNPIPPPVRTKVVATLGPASRSLDRIRALAQAGVSVFRLNTAHGTQSELSHLLAGVRHAEQELEQPLGVLMDLAGPKIRLGELPDGRVECPAGAMFRFVRGEHTDRPQTFTTTYEPLVDELSPGDRVLLADGTVALEVTETSADEALCRVTQAGSVRSRQGVNLPGVRLSVPALTPQDREYVAWGAAEGVDFVGLSFVRSSDDIRLLKQLLADHECTAQVIAKIEKPEALERLGEIIDASDGVMVARGDLGVEIDVARMAVVQKQIIQACRERRKPVITATQMLESMHHSLRPTRAEATDVANAILDGADACMLSGETAVGDYPIESVRMMCRIARATEEIFLKQGPPPISERPVDGVREMTLAAVYGSEVMARHCRARWIIVDSHTGGTARVLSRRRTPTPVVGFSDEITTLRRMTLYWGVTPVGGVTNHDSSELIAFLDRWARPRGLLQSGDRIVLVRGMGLVLTLQNTVVIHEYR